MNIIVRRVLRSDVKDMIETHHYSHSINGCMSDYCYAAYSLNGDMIGAMIYGRLAMHNQWRKYADSEDKVMELRRLVLIDHPDRPYNAASQFVSQSLKLLSRDWKRDGVVISYADKEYNHTGIIYQATNWRKHSDIPGAKVIVHGDRRYHDKAIRTKYKGELKPFAKRLKAALDSGEAYYTPTAGKICYVYHLDIKQRRAIVTV